jgi:four helix bundle protein
MDPRRYRNLRAWELGMELTEAVYKLAAELPPDERYGLTSQMKRAAASIPMNLAEGYGRGGREFVRFIGIAYGSLLELETAIELARRLWMVPNVTALEARTAELGKVLNGLRRSLVPRLGSDAQVREEHGDYGVTPCALRSEP